VLAERRGDLLPAVAPAQLDLRARHEAEEEVPRERLECIVEMVENLGDVKDADELPGLLA